MTGTELMMARIEDMEKRIVSLEKRIRLSLWSEDGKEKEEELICKYGEYVDKTVAAKILGVTRATVYAMLEDGRIKGGCHGKRVDVRSIAGYLTASKSRNRKGACEHEG